MLLFFVITVGVLLVPWLQAHLTNVSTDVANLIVIFLSTIFIVIYLSAKCGRVQIDELLPRRLDYLVVIIGLLILFWMFGIAVDRRGIDSNLFNAIRHLESWQFWAMVSVIVFFGPLLEEVFFRSYFLEILLHSYSKSIAVIITVIVAVAFHLGGLLSSLLWHFLSQLIFTVVYLKSRLGVSVILHCFVNGLGMALAR